MSGGHGGGHGDSHGGGHDSGSSGGHGGGGGASVGLPGLVLLAISLLGTIIDYSGVSETALSTFINGKTKDTLELSGQKMSKIVVVHGHYLPTLEMDEDVEFVIELADGRLYLSRDGLPANAPVPGNPDLYLYDRFRLGLEGGDRKIKVKVTIAQELEEPAQTGPTPDAEGWITVQPELATQ